MATPPDFSVGQVLTAAQMNAVGLWLIKEQTIGSAVTSVTVTGAFSADYEAYKIIISGGVASTANTLYLNLDGSTASYYSSIIFYAYASGLGNASGIGSSNVAYWNYAGVGSSSALHADITLNGPFLAKPTTFSAQAGGLTTDNSAIYSAGYHNVSSSYSAFRITLSAGTITGGTIRVYGYKG